MGTGVRDYTELDVWKLADQIRQETRPLLRRACFERDRDLKGQMERCSERPCPLIAEGFARYHPRDNASFVRQAKASLSEMLNHLERAVAKQFISQQESDILGTLCRRTRGAATAYIRYLETAEAPGVPRIRPRGSRNR